MKLKVLITGSSGMLGIDLSRELQNDYEVIGADVIAKKLKAAAVIVRPEGPNQSFFLRRPKDDEAISRFYHCDITKRSEVAAIIAKVNPAIVIHTAAMTDVDGCELDPKKAYKINSEGTRNVALACKAAGATLIYISTDFVFDGKKRSSYKETDKTNPLSVYADSKLKGEKAVKKILKNYFILRTGWLYGKHGKNFVDTIIAKAKGEKALRVVDDQIGSPTYTKDLAKAICVMIPVIVRSPAKGGTTKQSRCGIYHISNAGSVSWHDYAKEILKLSKSQTKVAPISSKELDRPAKRPKMSVLDNSKFIKFTGHKMRNWQEALKEYV